MPKNTILALSLLAIIASLLLGIKIGKNLGGTVNTDPSPTPEVLATQPPVPSTVSQATTAPGLLTYTDRNCGFAFSYKGNITEQNTGGYKSVILTDPDDPGMAVVSTCQKEIPRPPLVPERIEDIVLDGVPAKLYHDASQKDGTPRDEVIGKHPVLDHDVFIAGFGDGFDLAISSFKFLR